MKTTKDSTRIAVAAILSSATANRVSVLEVKIDPYLDAIETEFLGFSGLKWWEKARKIINLGEIAFDFYADYIDETQDDQKKALKDIAYVGWQYLRDKFNISLPWVGPFQDSFVSKFIDMGVEAGYDRVIRYIDNKQSPVDTTGVANGA